MNNRIRSLLNQDVETARKVRKIGPFVLLGTLIAFLIFGATSFWYLEHAEGERAIHQYYLKLAVDRRQFARDTSHRIFNETKNLFVIMDIEQSNRVQTQLVNAFREYERHLDIPRPTSSDFEFPAAFSYAWGLVSTLGHSTLAPRTVPGQLFAIFFSIIGVPLFVVTVAATAHGAYSILKAKCRNEKHLYGVFGGAIAVYIVLLLGYSVFLYNADIIKCLWQSIVFVVLTAFCIHTSNYTHISNADKVLTLTIVTLSLFIGAISVFAARSIWKRSITTVTTDKIEPQTDAPEPQRFQVIVDESGETKLQTATSE